MIEIAPSCSIAAFDVDAQNCFTPLCPDELPVPEGHTIVNELNEQAALAHWRIGSKDAHPPTAVWVANGSQPQLTPVHGHANADTHWNLHAVPGTHGFELLEGLPAVTDYDFFLSGKALSLICILMVLAFMILPISAAQALSSFSVRKKYQLYWWAGWRWTSV